MIPCLNFILFLMLMESGEFFILLINSFEKLPLLKTDGAVFSGCFKNSIKNNLDIWLFIQNDYIESV